jgi:hypothetical protein
LRELFPLRKKKKKRKRWEKIGGKKSLAWGHGSSGRMAA